MHVQRSAAPTHPFGGQVAPLKRLAAAASELRLLELLRLRGLRLPDEIRAEVLRLLVLRMGLLFILL